MDMLLIGVQVFGGEVIVLKSGTQAARNIVMRVTAIGVREVPLGMAVITTVRVMEMLMALLVRGVLKNGK